MPTAWPALTADDVLSGRGAKGATVGQALYDRDRNAEQAGTSVDVSGNTASATYVTIVAVTVKIPEHVRSSRLIRLYVNVSQGGGGTGFYRIQDNATGTNGTEQSTTSAADKESAITVPDNTWAGTERVINVQARTGGAGTVTLDSNHMAMNLRFSD